MCCVCVVCIVGVGCVNGSSCECIQTLLLFLPDPKCSSSSSTGSSKEGKHHKEEVYLVPVKLSQEVGTAARR